MSPHPLPCTRQQELIAQVQQHLERLAELARLEADAIKDRHSSLWLEIDKKIEEEIGEKERCMGALREHREQHGC